MLPKKQPTSHHYLFKQKHSKVDFTYALSLPFLVLFGATPRNSTGAGLWSWLVAMATRTSRLEFWDHWTDVSQECILCVEVLSNFRRLFMEKNKARGYWKIKKSNWLFPNWGLRSSPCWLRNCTRTRPRPYCSFSLGWHLSCCKDRWLMKIISFIF